MKTSMKYLGVTVEP